MISNDKSKNLKQQIKQDYKKLEQYQSSYISKMDVYYQFLENSLVLSYEEIKQCIFDELESIKTQLTKIERAKSTLQKFSSKANISKNKMENYNKNYDEISQNFIKISTKARNILRDLMCVHPITVESNDTLLISERENQVVFPYTTEEVEEIRKNGEYLSADEVIKEKFMRPLSDFRFPMISRYKETMKLIVDREGYSVLDGITLATEMMKKRYLHPAIIAACRTLDELDVYLDCLDKGETEDFKIFNIEYELHPLVIKGNGILSKFQRLFKRPKCALNEVDIICKK